jgi:hypothetical protein
MADIVPVLDCCHGGPPAVDISHRSVKFESWLGQNDKLDQDGPRENPARVGRPSNVDPLLTDEVISIPVEIKFDIITRQINTEWIA